MKLKLTYTYIFIFSIISILTSGEIAPSKRIIDLKPVGYWPATEGEGKIIKDYSQNKNHGQAINIPWNKQSGLLEFRNSFQYIEIPANKAYQSTSFSIGGWIFLRQKPVGGVWVPRMGLQLIGHHHRDHNQGAQISIRYNCVPVATTSDPQHKIDALGNWNWIRNEPARKGPGILELNSWHHVLFTFSSENNKNIGTGTLYLNGKMIAKKKNIEYIPKMSPLVAGNNAAWWMQTTRGATSLNGSLSQLVWFDRVLNELEIDSIFKDSKPFKTPSLIKPSTVVIKNEWHEIQSLPNLPTDLKRKVLDKLVSWENKRLGLASKELINTLENEIKNVETRLPAVKILKRLKANQANEILLANQKEIIRSLDNKDLSNFQIAETILTIKAMGVDTIKLSADSITRHFEKYSYHNSKTPSRVEEHIRNASIVTLNKLTKTNSKLQKKIVEELSSFKKYSDSNGHYISARKSKGYAEKDYTSSMKLKGSIYRVGEGVPWKGVEKVSKEQYDEIVNRLDKPYKAEAIKWAEGKYEHLYRIPIYKTTSDGHTEKFYLEGKNFVLYGEDAKLRGWSIFADEEGFIHLMGGQHNAPNSSLYIPGSWEKLGIGRKRNINYPRQMYWISRKPESIESFEFVGGRDNPRAIPIDYLNYMIFIKNHLNKNILFGRIDHYGWQSWGAFVYETTNKKWRAIGGDASNVYQNALANHSEWTTYAPRSTKTKGRIIKPMIRGRIPATSTGITALAWSWNPSFYNFCRDQWGIRFDRSGRMHVRVNLFGIQEQAYYDHNQIYAYSDDLGHTFFRANGHRVKTPLTTNPAPEYNASYEYQNNQQWLDLWLEVLKLAKVDPDQ
jgi:hypothetical protein